MTDPNITEHIPGLRLYSEANNRDCRWVKARRTAATRETIAKHLAQHRPRLQTPAAVLMVRIGPKLFDKDNNARALKAVQDEIATAFGVDDSDPAISLKPWQERGPYGVRIEIWIGKKFEEKLELVDA